MALLGIDLGTTRVVVASADRGNYPIVSFETPTGESVEWVPCLFAKRGDEVRTGHAALEVASDPSWELQRSLKRLLSTAGPQDLMLGLPVTELAARFLRDLDTALRRGSNLRVKKGERFEVAIAVPANATANQRLLTADAFASAGFKVARIVDEPSAAGLEYAWRRPEDARVKNRHVAVYDLGGGTFDASVIAMSDTTHEVLTTEGVGRLGGDDFDELLLALACASVGRQPPHAGPERDRLLELCRAEKEHFTPSTRRLSPDLYGDGSEPRVNVAEFELAVRPLIDRTIDALEAALERVRATTDDPDFDKHTIVAQVGGASQLPTVGRALRERYGRRVWRSPYPHAAVAIGLAIAAEGESGGAPRLAGRFTRNFGVWREREEGRGAAFDTVFPKDTPLPEGPSRPLVRVRRYRAAHNVAHFRFVECSRLTAEGAPGGDVTPWAEVRFPLDGALRAAPIDALPVARLPEPGDTVEERYRCDANGVVDVEIANLTAGYEQRFSLHGRANARA